MPAELELILDAARYQRDLMRTMKITQSAAASQAMKMARDRKAAAEKSAKANEKAAKKTGRAWKTAFAAVSGAAVGAFAKQAAIGFVTLAKEVVDYRNELTDAAARTGLMNEQLQALRMSAEASGQDFGPFLSSMERLPKLLANVDAGSKRAVAAFDNLGIKVHNTDGTLRQSSDVVEDIVKALGSIEDPSTRAIRGMDLFGRAGGKVVQALAAGAESFEEMNKFAREWGVETGPEAKKVAGDIQVELSAMQMAIRGVKDDFVQTALGGITSMKSLAQAIAFVGRFGVEMLDSQIKALTESWADLTNVFSGKTLREGVENVGAAAKGLARLSFLRPFETIADTAGALGAASVAGEEMGESMDALMASLEAVNNEALGGFEQSVSGAKAEVKDLSKEYAKLADIIMESRSDMLDDWDKLDENFRKTKMQIWGIATATGDWDKAATALAEAEARRGRDRLALMIEIDEEWNAQREATHAAELDRIKEESAAALKGASVFFGGLADLSTLAMEGMGDGASKAAKRWLVFYKVVAIAQAVIDGIGGVQRAFNDYPFPLSIGVGAVVAGLAAANVAKIAATSVPSYYVGKPSGRTSDGGHMSILHDEERVLTRTGARVVGDDGVRRANRGEPIGGSSTTVVSINGRDIAYATGREYKRGGSFRAALAAKEGRVGHWSP